MEKVEQTPRPALAATVHDPHCHLLGDLRRLATPLLEVFGGLAILATTRTAASVVSLLRDELDATVVQDSPGASKVGQHRRETVRAASAIGPSVIIHSLSITFSDGSRRTRPNSPSTSPTYRRNSSSSGRTSRAMNACPRRLRDTEAIVNHIYRLATGRAWDLSDARTSGHQPLAARRRNVS